MGKNYFFAIWFIVFTLGCQISDMEAKEVTEDSSEEEADYVTPGHAVKVKGIFQGYRFPSYPQTIRMCGHTLYYTNLGQCLVWEAFASLSPQEAVIQFYRQELGEKGFVSIDHGGMWRIEDEPQPHRELPNSPKVVKTLQVIEAEHHSLPDHCILPPYTKSVIIITISRPMARSGNLLENEQPR